MKELEIKIEELNKELHEKNMRIETLKGMKGNTEDKDLQLTYEIEILETRTDVKYIEKKISVLNDAVNILLGVGI